jgi:arginyl-tRNA synthetase
MKDAIRRLLSAALDRVTAAGSLAVPSAVGVRTIEVTRAKDPKFGDYSSNLALVSARACKRSPREIAALLAEALVDDEGFIERVEIAGAGFINFFVSTRVWHDRLRQIHRERGTYGSQPPGSGPRTLIEFVSANPTGPLHVGHGRGAAVGDSLARLLKFAGYDADTEYYVNDAGRQMKILGRSVYLRFRELLGDDIEFPEDHYVGQYIRELARELLALPLGDEMKRLPSEEGEERASVFARERILKGIQDDLADFGVTFDRYFSEKSLFDSGAAQQALERLRAMGRVEDREGAVWFTMEGEEDEKDRVLVRASGEPTYFASDAAYHLNKAERGYELLIDLWGSDHHGYVPRVKAAMTAMGLPPDLLKVLLIQFVTLVGGASMSTRRGEFITLREVIDEVGRDAARFFFLTKRFDSHLEFDLDLAKSQSKDNPVFYVQYMHARVASIFRIAKERGIPYDLSAADLSLLTLPEEWALIKRLADFPDVVAEAAQALEPHRITFYLMELAELFHSYYHDNRVLIEDEGMKNARLHLVEAVRITAANGLAILGVSAPERM